MGHRLRSQYPKWPVKNSTPLPCAYARPHAIFAFVLDALIICVERQRAELQHSSSSSRNARTSCARSRATAWACAPERQWRGCVSNAAVGAIQQIEGEPQQDASPANERIRQQAHRADQTANDQMFEPVSHDRIRLLARVDRKTWRHCRARDASRDSTTGAAFRQGDPFAEPSLERLQRRDGDCQRHDDHRQPVNRTGRQADSIFLGRHDQRRAGGACGGADFDQIAGGKPMGSRNGMVPTTFQPADRKSTRKRSGRAMPVTTSREAPTR